jgi:hypothetical protein
MSIQRLFRIILGPVIGISLISAVTATASDVAPAVHSNIELREDGSMILILGDDTLSIVPSDPDYTLEQMRSMPVGTPVGLDFDFQKPDLKGTLYYGFLPTMDQAKYSYPAFKRRAEITEGRASIDILNGLSGKYDFIDWQKTGVCRLGYRIVNEGGRIIYDGKLMVRGKGPFEVDTSIVEGPFVSLITDEGAVVSFETNYAVAASIAVAEKVFTDAEPSMHHEIRMTGLMPDTDYPYSVSYGPFTDSYEFHTAPMPGSRTAFTFAYASDGRGNVGGGERDLKGTNSYVLKKIAALCRYKDARFFHFTGDLIDGYTNDIGETELEYANWKRTIEPFASYMPFVAGIGNHESLMHYFSDGNRGAGIDKFPFEAVSTEAIFARNFVNPHNGPVTEDDSKYDPNPLGTDFPPYDETAFYYVYDNVAVISLNSNYWYSYSITRAPEIGGNLHGYIMDNQMKWLEQTLELLEDDENIDHIFVTSHTPFFPNGGHVSDDMWYGGNNEPRPTIAGKPVDKGIIERRDELLDLMMNHSTKVKAALTGDEHNYSLLRVSSNLQIYPDDWDGPRLTKFRPFLQINDGAAGAPYYGREETPWMDHVQKLSTLNAVVFFHVDGDKVIVEVINPDTLEEIDRFEL